MKRDQGYFRDVDLANSCAQECEAISAECKDQCNDEPNCLLKCNQAQSDCTVFCPCFEKCPQGCSGCPTGLCQCQEPNNNTDFIHCKERSSLLFLQRLFGENLDYSIKQINTIIYDKCISCPPADFECARDYKQGIDGCPCQSGCPNGCPCPEYQFP